MLDGLLGRGFSSKCKLWIKETRTRYDVIRRKRDATQRFLKKDVSDLLANGLDINAFGRVEGLVKELTLSWCYDFIEQCCDCILKHLTIMQKQSECPEECREAVSSLMFAAARFSDLPELRDLRNIFQEKYGSFVQHFVNKEFAENLSSKPPTKEKKIQLMQDIAAEFSIRWDSRTFEQTMSNPSASVPEKPKTFGSFNLIEDKHKLPNGQDTMLKRYKSDPSSRVRHGVIDKGDKLHGDRQGNHTDNLYQQLNGREAPDIPFQGRHEPAADRHKLSTGKEAAASETVSLGSSSHGKRHEGIGVAYKLHNIGENNVSGRGNHIDNSYKQLNGREADDIPSKGRQELTADRHKLSTGKDAALETVRLGSSSHGKRHEGIDGAYKLHNIGENIVSRRGNQDSLSHGKSDFSAAPLKGMIKSDERAFPFVGNPSQHNTGKSTREGEEEERFYYNNNAIPPPYVKPPKASKHGAERGSKGANLDPSTHKGATARNTADRLQTGSDHRGHERPVIGSERSNGYCDHERQAAGPERVNGHHEKSYRHHDDLTGDPVPKARSLNGHRDHERQAAGPEGMNSHHEKSYRLHDDLTGDPIPKTRSSRRRHSRSPSSHYNAGNLEAAEPPMDPSAHVRASSSQRSERIQRGLDLSDHERQLVGSVGYRHEKDYYYQDDVTGDPLQRPRSMRRRHMKSLSHDEGDYSEGAEVVRRNSSSRRRENSRRGMQVLVDDGRDEEEKIIDRLLLHYSKKPTAYEQEKTRKKSKAHPSRPWGESPEIESKDHRPSIKTENAPTTTRSISLPKEQAAASETAKVFARTYSFQPEMSNQAPHVHPKLPDYDDLAARFAALKGR